MRENISQKWSGHSTASSSMLHAAQKDVSTSPMRNHMDSGPSRIYPRKQSFNTRSFLVLSNSFQSEEYSSIRPVRSHRKRMSESSPASFLRIAIYNSRISRLVLLGRSGGEVVLPVSKELSSIRPFRKQSEYYPVTKRKDSSSRR